MRRRKVIIGILALGICGVLAMVFWPEKPEPVYKGRKLSDWVMEQTSFGMLTVPAEEAVLAVGTNGIPFYLDWIDDNGSKVSRTARKAWTKLERLIGRRPPDRAQKLQIGAFHAFQSLGTQAAEAVPKLENLATNSPSSETRQRAYFSLLIVRNSSPQIGPVSP